MMHVIAWISLLTGLACAVIIVADEVRHPQHMWIMNVVWPVTALFGSLLWLWGYFRYGRLATHETMISAERENRKPPNKTKPFAAMVAEGASHCGAGCTMGDICAEWLVFAFPVVAVWFGWTWLFADKTFATWAVDYILAFLFGIAFQYFTIAPMRKLGIAEGLWAAVKADTLSLTAWQIGMYGFMAFAKFWMFQKLLRQNLEVNSAEFWFMMQIAMICGFATAFPVNWWLIRAGIKEKM